LQCCEQTQLAKRLNRTTPVEPLGTPTARWRLDDTAKAAYVTDRIQRWKMLYEIEQNPMFAWRAYELVREAGIETPTWLLEYLDLAAQNLTMFEGKVLSTRARKTRLKDDFLARGVMAALGFVPGGVEQTFIANKWPDAPEATREKSGRFNPFNGIGSGPSDNRHSTAVWIYLQMGRSLPDAKKAVAKAHGVVVRTVERALKKYPLELIEQEQRTRDTK
jgi:hypothetical protein